MSDKKAKKKKKSANSANFFKRWEMKSRKSFPSNSLSRYHETPE